MEANEKVRAFVAIELPEELKDSLVALQDSLRDKKQERHIKWAKPSTMHLTISFLGDIPTNRIEALKESLSIATRGLAPFTLSTGAIEIRNKRVLWLSINNSPKLAELAERVETAVESLIEERVEDPKEKSDKKHKERAFRAHLTLARIKDGKGYQPLREKVAKNSTKTDFSFIASEAVLFSSFLRPEGAEHTPLKRIVFGKET